MPPTDQTELRAHVVKLLRGGNAHVGFDGAVRDLDAELAGRDAPELARTAWQIAEHMRVCQRDILDYLTAVHYEEPPFPSGVWPDGASPPSEEAWQESLRQFRADLQALIELVDDPGTDLYATLRGTDHTVLREALIVADHNAYHIGQLVLLRLALDADTAEIAF